MTHTTASTAAILTPEEVADLVVRPVLEQSIAAQVSTIVTIGSHDFRIPIVSADPSAAWVAEGAEITPSDATITELTVTPSKVAGLTIISNELANDSSPEAAQVVGDGLARDIARKVDAAFFSNTTANGPSGLGSLTTTVVSAGGSWSNTDPFFEAIAAAENASTVTTAFIANPADALLLAKVKKATGSNEPLLGNDPTAPTKRVIGGVPLYVSPAVAVGVVWAIPQIRVMLVVRSDTSIEVDGSPFFTSDRTAVRAIMRVGFGFTDAAAIAKITKA